MAAQKSYSVNRTIQFRRHGNFPEQFGCQDSTQPVPRLGSGNARQLSPTYRRNFVFSLVETRY
jgi:hypothetical protein